MSIERMLRKARQQTAVYWAPLSVNAEGFYDYDDPIEIKCRWTDAQLLNVESFARQNSADAQVIVDRELKDGGLLWLGKLADWRSPYPPTENEGGYEITLVGALPDFKAHSFYRQVLVRIRGGRRSS